MSKYLSSNFRWPGVVSVLVEVAGSCTHHAEQAGDRHGGLVVDAAESEVGLVQHCGGAFDELAPVGGDLGEDAAPVHRRGNAADQAALFEPVDGVADRCTV